MPRKPDPNGTLGKRFTPDEQCQQLYGSKSFHCAVSDIIISHTHVSSNLHSKCTTCSLHNYEEQCFRQGKGKGSAICKVMSCYNPVENKCTDDTNIRASLGTTCGFSGVSAHACIILA